MSVLDDLFTVQPGNTRVGALLALEEACLPPPANADLSSEAWRSRVDAVSDAVVSRDFFFFCVCAHR